MERDGAPYMPFPFLLGYAAAVLEGRGVDVAVIDACAEKLDRRAFLDRVASEAPDVILSEVSTPSFHEDRLTLKALREDIGFDGDLLLAGLHKPLEQRAFLDAHPEVTATCVGEYEETLLHWVQARQNGQGGAVIPGLITRGNGGAVLDGGRKESPRGLDQFPWPARHLFPMDRYHDLPGGIPAPSVQMWASRGCSFTCSFCAWPQILYADNQYRTRSPQAVADEVEAMLRQGYRSYYFDDDTFNLGKKRTQQLAEEFTRRGFTAPWGFMGRADTCEVEHFDALRRTGLQAVKFGVESADTARLKRIGKNLDVEKVRRSVRAVRDMGVKVHLTFMFGLPGETLETMQRTLDLAYELDPDSAQFTIAVPFPGSRLHDELSTMGRLTDIDWADLDGYRTGVVRTDALEAEQIVSFVHAVHRRWERRDRPPGPAPKIPVAEIGGSNVAVALIARSGEEHWLARALQRVVQEPGPAREIVVVAPEGDEALEAAAAAACDWATWVTLPGAPSLTRCANAIAPACSSRWILILAADELPAPGFLEPLLQHTRGWRPYSAVSLMAPTTRAGHLTRWGAVLRAPSAEDGAAWFAPLSGTCWSREMIEENAGWAEDLVLAEAELDFVVRGLQLGHRAVALPAHLLEGGPRGEACGAADAGRSWTRRILRGTTRDQIEAAPLPLLRHTLRHARRFGVGGAVEFAAAAVVAAATEGGTLIQQRRVLLGRRRTGETWLDESFRAAEAALARSTPSPPTTP